MLLLNIKMPVLCRKKDGGSTFSHDRHTKTNHNGAKKALFFCNICSIDNNIVYARFEDFGTFSPRFYERC